MRLCWLDLGGPADLAGAAVAAGQVRLALLPPLDQGGHEATAGRSNRVASFALMVSSLDSTVMFYAGGQPGGAALYLSQPLHRR